MVGDGDSRPKARTSIKAYNSSFNNYPKWKDKLRENCYKRVREARTHLLWKLRLPETKDQSLHHKEFLKSAFQDIVSDELRKIKDSSLDDCFVTSNSPGNDEALWQYDGLHTAYDGEHEEILLEMQRIFYEDLMMEPTRQETSVRTWEEEEDEYLAHAVYEHMQLNDKQVLEGVWCPICKQGVLQQNYCFIYCTLCDLKLNKCSENRLAEAHEDHLDRGCRLRPKFCVETKFGLTALYINCQSCQMFEVVA